MNPTGRELMKSYNPELAIIVYHDGGSDYYLESHVISSSGQILAGKPLLQETIDDIVDVLYQKRRERVSFSGAFPSCLLSFNERERGEYEMVWYREPTKKVLHFSESLNIPSGMASVPALLFHVANKSLSVFALSQNTRPEPGTKLFKAPFHNIYSGGIVCLGSANVKKPTQKTFENEIQYWEDIFWKSEFSHLNGGENPTKTNINLLWKSLIKTGADWNNDELVAHSKRTLKDILK